MPEIKIPDSLKPKYDKIVELLYEGDEEKALAAAIEIFVHQEGKKLPSEAKFSDIMGKRLKVEADKEGYADEKLTSAFDKIQERKKRLQSFTFGKDEESGEG